MLIDLGPDCFIAMLVGGKESWMPITWWIARSAETRVLNTLGEEFAWTTVVGPARRISGPGWYVYHDPKIIIGEEVALREWDVHGNGRSMRARSIRKGHMLDGRHGAFPVGEAPKIEKIALVRCNATDAFGLYLGEMSDDSESIEVSGRQIAPAWNDIPAPPKRKRRKNS